MHVPRAALLGGGEEEEEAAGTRVEDPSAHSVSRPTKGAGHVGAWQRVERALLAKAKRDKAIADRVVDLNDVLRDVYEFMGASELGYFAIYVLLGILVLFMHWNTNLPVMKSNVQQTFLGFGDPPVGQGYQLSSVSCMYDGAVYLNAYAQNFISSSESRGLPDSQTQIDEYSIVRYMRISAALQRNCNYKDLLCDADPTLTTTFNAAGHWKYVESIPGVHLGPMMVAELISSSIATRNASLGVLRDLQADISYLSKYAYLISLDMVLTNQISRSDTIYTSLQVKRSMGVFDAPDQTIKKVSVTTSLVDGLYVSTLDKARIAVEILFVCMNLFYLAREADIAFVAYQQFGGWAGISRYLNCGWTRVNLLGFILTGAWCWWYMSLVIEDVHRDKAAPVDTAAVNGALDFGTSLDLWCFVGIISNVLLGVRLLKYMDLHASLRIYARLLDHTWRTLRDFLVFFMYLLLLLGLGALAYFQISGGNPAFVTVQDALQSMALLTFGFLDWGSFRNEGLGLGSWQPTIVILFWLVVIGLLLISQNIILSIVVLAYEKAKRTEPIVEASIVTLLIHRMLFDLRRLSYRLRMLSLDLFVEETVNTFHHELYLHGTGQTSQGLFASYIAARWAICQFPEVIMLRNFFYDYSQQTFVKQSRWDAAYKRFEPVDNPRLQRSFGHLLNKVQDSDEVLHAVVASSALSKGIEKDAYAAGVQAGPAKRRSSLSLAIGSLVHHSTSQDDDSGHVLARVETSAPSLWGMRSGKVAPEYPIRNGMPAADAAAVPVGSAHATGAADSAFGAAAAAPAPAAGYSDMVRVKATCEEPMDFEELMALMTGVIPGNREFVTATHLFKRRLNRFSPARLPCAADYIMRVYSFPRETSKSHGHHHSGAEASTSTAAPKPAPPLRGPWQAMAKAAAALNTSPGQAQTQAGLKPALGPGSVRQGSAPAAFAALHSPGVRSGALLHGASPSPEQERPLPKPTNQGSSYALETLQLLDVEESDAVQAGEDVPRRPKGKKKGKGSKRDKRALDEDAGFGQEGAVRHSL